LKPDDAAYHTQLRTAARPPPKKFDEAKSELQTAARAPTLQEQASIFFNLGAVLVNGGNYGQAEEAFKQAIAADPNYADAHLPNTAVALMAKATTTGDGKVVPPPGTAEAFQKYLELKPDGKRRGCRKGHAAGNRFPTCRRTIRIRKRRRRRHRPRRSRSLVF